METRSLKERNNKYKKRTFRNEGVFKTKQLLWSILKVRMIHTQKACGICKKLC